MSRILVITSYWPNSAQPYRAVFHARLVRLLEMSGLQVGVIVLPTVVLEERKREGMGKCVRSSFDGIEFFQITGTLALHDTVLDGPVFRAAVRQAFRQHVRCAGIPDRIVCGFAVHGAIAARILHQEEGIPYFIHEAYSGFLRGYFDQERTKRLLGEVLRSAETVWPVSAAIKKAIVDIEPDARCLVIPYHVDEEEFALGAGATKQYRFCSLGNLTSNKRVDLVLRAFRAAFSDDDRVSLTVAGIGDQADHLGALATSLGLSHSVQFLGAVPHSQVPSLLQTVDCLMCASKFETFGNCIIEAMSCGAPVIGVRGSGGPDSIIRPTNGILVDSPSVDRLADAMRAFYLGNPTLAREAIRAETVARYGKRAIAKRLHSALALSQ